MSARACLITNTFPTRAEPSPRAFRACAAFGVVPTHAPDAPRRIDPVDTDLIERMKRSSVTHITGPSGSGKTTLLHAIARRLDAATEPRPLEPHIAVIDQVCAPTKQAAALLSACGLAEPKHWARPAGELSTGQAARLGIARRVALARRGQAVVIDELASTLDRVTAAAVAASIPRLARRCGITIVTAASAEDVPTMLDACLTIDAATRRIRPAAFRPVEIVIQRGTMNDYAALKAHHYRANDPAIVERVLRAVRVDPRFPNETVGVLCVSRPTLNASWRRLAFGDRFHSGDKPTDARRLNAELRTISRIIVEPRARSLGVASRLVRAYTDDPLTPCTEAIASIGTLTGFFTRAGMRPVTPPRPDADLRLLDALEHARLDPRSLTTTRPDAFVSRELGTWARARKIDPDDPNLTTHAAVRLLSSPRAYTHTLKGGDHEHQAEPD